MLPSVLYQVGAMVAVLPVEVPLPLIELVGKTGADCLLPHVVQFLVRLTKRRNPSFFYLWMIYAHPLFFLIVISFLLPTIPFYVSQISSPYGTLTYDALSAHVFEIGSLLMMVIYDHPLKSRKMMTFRLGIDPFVEYLD